MSDQTLEEILASPDVGRPETTHRMCVAGKLNAELERIDVELDELLAAEQEAQRAAEGVERPRRMAEKRNPRIDELIMQREDVRERMAGLMVDLLLRARVPAAWREWVQANPPREGDQLDARVGYNIDALTAAIETNPRDFVVTIQGQAYTDDQWATIVSAAAPGDMWRLMAKVRSLHESVVDVPKSLSGLLETRRASKTSA